MVTGYWLLVTGYWLLAIGYWQLGNERSLSAGFFFLQHEWD